MIRWIAFKHKIWLFMIVSHSKTAIIQITDKLYFVFLIAYMCNTADETWGVRIHVQAFNKKQSQTTVNRYVEGKTKSNPRACMGRRTANTIYKGLDNRGNPSTRAIVQSGDNRVQTARREGSDVTYDTEASNAYRVSNFSRSCVPEHVLFSENHFINEKRSLTFCPITCVCRNIRNPISYFTSFHSDLFNYIFKYPVIQVIWRIKKMSENFNIWHMQFMCAYSSIMSYLYSYWHFMPQFNG